MAETPDTALELKLGYRFQNQAVMDLALTHRSHAQPHNERLEFLGDAVLGWVVAECLYRMYPEWNEGQLTRARAGLVRQKTLAELADSMNLGEQLRVGGGIVLEGAARERALASALEALLGGIVLEAGPETAQSVIERLLRRWWPIISDFADHKDAKTRLQERLQGEGLPPPRYLLETAEGPGHRRRFRVRCEIPEQALSAQGTGGSVRLAEQAAAERLIAKMDHG
ncbi:ribonuclease III [mine drainage metagenome]|uniref:ribonuclease III n=1 Tax=mine drainage metagenome TaxID=410659 RepID=T1D5M8_9ZZZZ